MAGQRLSDKTGNSNHVDHFFLINVPIFYSVALVVLTNISLFCFRRSVGTKSAHHLASALEVWLKMSVKHQTD